MNLRTFFVGMTILVSLWAYRSLPDTMAIHWNISGQIDNWASKNVALGMQLMILVGMAVMLELLPKLDPKKAQYQIFKPEWEIIKSTLIGFFSYITILMIGSSLNQNIEFMRWFFVGLGIFFMLLGNYLSKVRQNYFVGIKIPWTLNNENNWNKTHRVGGWCFVVMGLFVVANGAFDWRVPQIIFGLIMLAVVIPIGYSIWLAKMELPKS